MRILFLDQSGQLGGAELCLSDLALFYRDRCTVGVFVPGPFPEHLRSLNVPVVVLARQALDVQKQSGWVQSIKAVTRLCPLVYRTVRLAARHDCIYANTQKALVVGAIASLLSRKPLVYHLHDIVSLEHFSRGNRKIIVTLANRAALVIANSQASKEAFVAAGGNERLVEVAYNGFDSARYQLPANTRDQLRAQLGVEDRFVVGHFSRLSPWKGQHLLVEALSRCPSKVIALFVGSALFGEDSYAQQLKEQIESAGLGDRVQFLGFRSDIPALMSACDMVAHTSTAAEPFGRVIAEGLLCNRPVVAAAAGGALEIVEHNETGWLTPVGDAEKLAEIIRLVYREPSWARSVANRGRAYVEKHFDTIAVNAQIDKLLAKRLSFLLNGFDERT